MSLFVKKIENKIKKLKRDLHQASDPFFFHLSPFFNSIFSFLLRCHDKPPQINSYSCYNDLTKIEHVWISTVKSIMNPKIDWVKEDLLAFTFPINSQEARNNFSFFQSSSLQFFYMVVVMSFSKIKTLFFPVLILVGSPS